jgi:hypothetical protein
MTRSKSDHPWSRSRVGHKARKIPFLFAMKRRSVPDRKHNPNCVEPKVIPCCPSWQTLTGKSHPRDQTSVLEKHIQRCLVS